MVSYGHRNVPRPYGATAITTNRYRHLMVLRIGLTRLLLGVILIVRSPRTQLREQVVLAESLGLFEFFVHQLSLQAVKH